MLNTPLFRLTIAAAAATVLVCPRAAALSKDDILLYAPFDGTVEAQLAAGNPKPVAHGKAEFAAGRFGQGCLTGRKGDQIRYETAGNLDVAAGTVALWVKPLSWHEGDAFMRFWFRVGEEEGAGGKGSGTFLWLYKFHRHVPLYWLVQQDYYQRSASYAGGRNVYKVGEWTHIAASWCGPMMRVYANGKLLGSARTPTPTVLRSYGPHFHVGGESWTPKGDTQEKSDSVIDEFYTFRRPLTRGEIKALCEKGPAAVADKETVAPADLEIESVFLPSRDELKIRLLVTGRRPGDFEGLTTVFSIENVDEARPALPAPVTRPVREVNSEEVLSTKALKPGAYRVLAALLNAGEVTSLVSAEFEKPEVPEWLGCRVGIPIKPPKPWTPILRQDRVLECWERQVEYGDSLFPVRMSSRGRELLARPIRLVARVGGKESEATDVRLTWGKVTELRADFAIEARLGAVVVKAAGWMEYDGFIWTELRIPVAPGASLDGLRLEVPLRADVARLQHGPVGGWHAGPTNGEVHAWNHRLGGQPFLWLGDEEVGLQWCTDNSYCWENQEADKAFVLTPGAVECLLTVTFIDANVSLDRPLSYTVGLQATPVRPLPENWRSYDLGMNCGWRKTLGRGETVVPRWAFWYQKWNLQNEAAKKDGWLPGYPAVGPWTRELVEETFAGNGRPFLYNVPSWAWRGAPEYKTFHSEWHPDSPPALPFETAGAKHTGIWRTAPSFQDWVTWRWWRTLKDNPWLAEAAGGIYNDVVQSFWGPDPRLDRHGLPRTRHELLGAREIQKRMYVALQKEWPHLVISNHQSYDTHMCQLGFAHVYVTGEHYAGNTKLGNEQNYHNVMDLASCRAELLGERWGVPVMFLPEIAPSGAPFKRVYGPEGIKPAEHLAGLLLVHDAIPWAANAHPVPFMRLAALKEGFGWDEKTAFVGYWRSAEFAKTDASAAPVVTSLFRRPGKVLFAVMNNSDADATVTLAPDWAKLGVAVPKELIDAYSATDIPFAPLNLKELGSTGKLSFAGEGAPVEMLKAPVRENRVTFRVEKRNFRALVTR